MSQEIFSYGFNFLERYGTPYRFLNNLIANKISINTTNDDQRDFVFNLMKGYNVSNFFKINETRDLDRRNSSEKSRSKAIEVLLKCEQSVEGIKKFLPKRFNKDITEDQKSILLNSIKLFDIRNTIVSLFRNGVMKSLECQGTVKLEQEPKPEESVGERIKLRKQRLNKIVENEKKVNLELFKRYFKHPSPADMYKNLNKSISTERNKI